MCGIAGYSGPLQPAFLDEANRIQAHRGPDDSGSFFVDGANVGLGHVRLSIVDLSSLGHQPMKSADGSTVIVYNGEIYNFPELRAELEAKGRTFRSNSDTEVVLELYLEHGDEMLSRLNGIFAFAIWDQSKQSLFVARDALGVKPLYYAQTGEAISFASEMKALLGLAPQDPTLDADAINRYLNFLWCPGTGTPLRSVRKLAPGQAMWISAGRISRKWTWYRLPALRPSDDPCPMSASEAIEGTITHFRQAVHRQMLSDVPVGAFLSGGLDSSAVAVFAKEVDPHLPCFTINMKGGQEAGMVEDLPYARHVATHLGVKLNIVDIDAKRMADDIEHMVMQLDEPMADPASLNVLYIAELARQNGIKVLLSGAGGDDLFTGYRRHYALLLEKYWRWLPQPVRQAIGELTSSLNQNNPAFRRISKMFNNAGADAETRLINYFRWTNRSDLATLFSRDFRAQISDPSGEAPIREFLHAIPAGSAPLDEMLALEQRFFLTDHNLVYTDKMSMAAGVETRVPFLDLDLVEFAARVPIKFKQKGSIGKWVLKKALEPYLPHNIIYRPKTGFGAPLRRWMKNELRTLLNDHLSVANLARRGIFDPVAVQKLIAANQVGQIDASYTLLSVLCIEIWCRAYVDRVGQKRSAMELW